MKAGHPACCLKLVRRAAAACCPTHLPIVDLNICSYSNSSRPTSFPLPLLIMATQEPRRSGRVRKQVKSYANEQAEDVATASSSKRKRETTQGEEEAPKKKSNKKIKQAQKWSDADETTTTSEKSTKSAKASSSKPRRAATNSSWHGDAAERRIKANNRNIRKLAPDQEERRLRR
jgi:hypothetical protein